jgi:hypothetical protein
MSAEGDDLGARFALPEGYSATQKEDGLLAIYDSHTGDWLGDFAPALSYAQEMVQDLISVYERDNEHAEQPAEVVIDAPIPDEITGWTEEIASERREDELGHLAWDDPRAAALRIRELEIVADLSVKALQASGDEATAGVVRSVLEHELENT